jgi:hypothetical protein
MRPLRPAWFCMLIITLVLESHGISACPIVPTPTERTADATDVFAGELLEIRSEFTPVEWLASKVRIALDPNRRYRSHLRVTVMTFDVKERYKGDSRGAVDVRVYGDHRSLDSLVPHRVYVVYAERDGEQFWAEPFLGIDDTNPPFDPRRELRALLGVTGQAVTPHN